MDRNSFPGMLTRMLKEIILLGSAKKIFAPIIQYSAIRVEILGKKARSDLEQVQSVCILRGRSVLR